MKPVISVEHLSKTYKRSWLRPPTSALKDVSLSVEEGEVFGFIGANGAGKSTTIKILTGVLRATSGRGALFGYELSDPRSRKGLGYVPENPQLYEFLTPLEVLRMGLQFHHVQVDDEVKHCMNWLARFELAHVAKKTLRTFSKGMSQRVALAHAMAIQPKMLILDEPLSGLDPVGRRDVVEILAEYKKNGGTIFLTSHVLHDVERLADRFGLIHKGELLTVRSPADLVGEEQMYTLRSSGNTQVDGMKAEAVGRWYCEIVATDLWPQLDRLRAQGHAIVEIKPTLSLENAFMRYIGIGDSSHQRPNTLP